VASTVDPKDVTLDEWMRATGTCSGTFTFNGVTYRDAHEVEWRLANGDWLKPERA
jgi:hypothetical protein